MKILLIKDVFKLGRAGDIKKVANGYGRNYLIPQGLAILATPGALKQVDQIRSKATASRDALNQELGGLAQQLSDLIVNFSMKAGETGKLYGSITTQNIASAIKDESGIEVDRRNIETQAIRTLGAHKVTVRLTIDLMPEITVLVRREGEALPQAKAKETVTIADSGVESETDSGELEAPAADVPPAQMAEPIAGTAAVDTSAEETELEDSSE